MSIESKEEKVLELFFNEASKQWHFEEILKISKVSRSKANKWLKKLTQEHIIKHIKPIDKMPYFKADFDSPAYRTKKRIYAVSLLQKSGFLDHLISLPKAKTVIIFGSFVRADWYSGSDIDVFIYGEDDDIDIATYEKVLHRTIQVFVAPNLSELKRMGPGLLRNIIEGMLMKGKINFVEVMPIATI